VSKATAQALYNHGEGARNVKQVSFKPGPEDWYTECAEVTRSGRLFQTRAAATGKLGHN